MVQTKEKAMKEQEQKFVDNFTKLRMGIREHQYLAQELEVNLVRYLVSHAKLMDFFSRCLKKLKNNDWMETADTSLKEFILKYGQYGTPDKEDTAQDSWDAFESYVDDLGLSYHQLILKRSGEGQEYFLKKFAFLREKIRGDEELGSELGTLLTRLLVANSRLVSFLKYCANVTQVDVEETLETDLRAFLGAYGEYGAPKGVTSRESLDAFDTYSAEIGVPFMKLSLV